MASTNLISGLSSGFDWSTMIDQLIAIDHKPIDAISTKQTEYKSKLTEWQSFNTKLLALKTAASDLKKPESFNIFKAAMTSDSSTVSASNLLMVTTSTTANRGSYSLTVNALATAQKLSSSSFASRTSALGADYTGDILINGTTITIASTDTLNNIRDKINNVNSGENPTGMTAGIVSYSTTDHRLILTSDETGADGMNLENGGALDILNRLGLTGASGGFTDLYGVIGDVANTSASSAVTSATLIKDIDGYTGYLAGDYIHLEGTDTAEGTVSDDTFILSDTTTLQDLLDKITSLFGDVTASIDGSGKITVVDNSTGESPLSIAMSVKDSGGAADDTLKFDTDGNLGSTGRQIVAGADASITVDGVTTSRSTNTIDDMITGVTLDLLKADIDTTVTLNITRDADAVISKINTFVTNYNSIASYIKTQSTYDQTAKTTGGILFGDGTLASVKSDLTSILVQNVWGVAAEFSTLGLVGVSVDRYGQLSVDESKLRPYLSSNFNDVKNLFVADGTTSVGTLEYIGYGKNTKQGEYTVNITQVATQSTSAVSDNTGLSGDETLTITEGSNVATVDLTAGMTMSQIINAINDELSAGSVNITASTDLTGHLVLASNSYGSANSFTIHQLNNLLWTSGDQTVNNGLDVAGTINGEAATGSGQTLKGNSGDANIDGLSVKYSGATTGEIGTVKMTLGAAELFDRALYNITDSQDGYVSYKQQSLQENIKKYQTQIEDMEAQLATKKEQMTNRYVQMELALQKIQSQSSWLTSQLTAAENGWK